MEGAGAEAEVEVPDIAEVQAMVEEVIVLVAVLQDSAVRHLVGAVIAGHLLMTIAVLNHHILMDTGVAGAEDCTWSYASLCER